MPRVDFGFAATCGAPAQQADKFPRVPGQNLWFRDTAHSGFDALDRPTPGEGARIAHIDTGYDSTHQTLPKHLRLDLQRNFVERDKPNDARHFQTPCAMPTGPRPATR